MSETYLNTKKSVIISSPAGSGKTEKLARRYVAHLLDGTDVEKILAITFTEKAAAEMKERILSIIKREYPDLNERIWGKVPLMRISTIHAFCLKLLKRFSIELGMDPSLDVADEVQAQEMWNEAVYGELMSERERPSVFFETASREGINGISSVTKVLTDLYKNRPRTDLLLSRGIKGENGEALGKLYLRCMERYTSIKAERHLIDFGDLETLALKALTICPDWQNILYSFDEHTDHILVDEFQDTSRLQWMIIDKLTEEWRSGLGAKRERGKQPTIFLVGDDKQSIYLFRGADASVFGDAKKEFPEWLGENYHYVEVRENYRSLPAIINFTNSLFEKIMPGELIETWRTAYSRFDPVRLGEGRVELMLYEPAGGAKENRQKEAGLVAENISSLIGNYRVSDGDSTRPCKYSDMAILLNRRTHLAVFEEELRKKGIPFMVLKGIGFYESQEVAVLREFINFIVDPSEDYSLFCLLRSPVFGVPEGRLLKLLSGETPIIDRLKDEAVDVYVILSSWLESDELLSLRIERMLSETGGWTHFWERQRHANVKKFISLIESYESKGLCPIEIREKLLRQRESTEVAKANVSPEGLNAVSIMTVHAAKGLQFPMVFIPSLDESHIKSTGGVLVDEEAGIVYEPDSDARKKSVEFLIKKDKEQEEAKRLFYVAVTRAMDFLSLSAPKTERPRGRLDYIQQSFDLSADDKPFELLSEDDLKRRSGGAVGVRLDDETPFMEEPVYSGPLVYEPSAIWRDVTENLEPTRSHGEDWILMGSIIHRLFEELSEGTLNLDDVTGRATVLLKGSGASDDIKIRLMETLEEDMQKLRGSGHLVDIILPSPDSHTELPFIYEKGKSIFRGRIDRLLLRNGQALVYDYKTFPAAENEIPGLIEKYRFQMEIYAEAASRIFKIPARSYLLFTHIPKLVEIKPEPLT